MAGAAVAEFGVLRAVVCVCGALDVTVCVRGFEAGLEVAGLEDPQPAIRAATTKAHALLTTVSLEPSAYVALLRVASRSSVNMGARRPVAGDQGGRRERPRRAPPSSEARRSLPQQRQPAACERFVDGPVAEAQAPADLWAPNAVAREALTRADGSIPASVFVLATIGPHAH
jgi:hypothetical protein